MRVDNRFKRRAIAVYGMAPVHNMLQNVKLTAITQGMDEARRKYGSFAALDDNIALSVAEEIYDDFAEGMSMGDVITKYGDMMCLAHEVDRLWPGGAQPDSESDLYAYLEATS